MNNDSDLSCDVLIIGAGLAGGTLARQLRLEQPDLDIVVLEKEVEFPPGLDESSGEEFTNYANRILQIGPYLRKNHYVSSGMRFFFDSAEKDLPIERMSEIGGKRPHPIPTYLIDRPAMERDLCELNRNSGVRVLLGTSVLNCGPGESPAEAITLDRENGHLVRTTAGVIRCKWLVDAAGEASPLARMLDLVPEDGRNPIAASWARVDGCLSLDALGDSAWRHRVPHWGRASSMTYFMYRGYWIWLLPLSESQYSIGVVFDRRHTEPAVGSGDELLAFLREHRALRDILGPDPTLRSFGTRKRLARLAKQQFSEDRWFLTGNAATVLDPMFATSSWLFTENNKLIGEFIKSDREERTAELPAFVHHFDIRVRSRYEKLLNTLGHYVSRGSFDAWAAWLALRTRVYYNRIVPDALEDHRILLKFSRTHGTDCPCDETVMGGKLARLLSSADRLTEEFVELIERDEKYYTHNSGVFLDSATFDQDETLMPKVYEPRDWTLEGPADERSYEIFCRTLVQRLIELSGGSWSEERFKDVFNPDWDGHQPLDEIYKGVAG
ncbi:NAD(P)/FAD-dependent oxidoreductase [Streptomyces sp. Isolate_45]|uniref:NAD(P)/FAD-dependent oxidoreductase n=1 Tax=Streptomyces sp. Isolate_45 TaxID=2950111 RepID=UPI002481E4B3|nr:NAD(P)/FAD-dependent oxidoreductase [Streptomyces sp. Isolate_45]MDA5285012.1 NAD(P)/FAD-dependent oxidoreductase [Streptomyces sp. Isolate_45]